MSTKAPARPQIRTCTVYRHDNGHVCGDVAGPTGRCERHEQTGKWSK